MASAVDSSSGFGRERGLTIIEDAAQAWGAEWNGVKAGGLGDVAAFSFYPTKNLSAAGDAGMVTTNSDDLAERVKMLRQHGMRRRYYHDELGWNTRMDGFQGAVLAVKLKYIGAWNRGAPRTGRSLSRLICQGGIGRGRALSSTWRRSAARAAGRTTRLAPVCDSRSAPRRVARVSHRAGHRIGDLLSCTAAPAGGAEGPGLRCEAIFPRPSAPRAKCWRCPSSRNCARTSSRPWSRPLPSFWAKVLLLPRGTPLRQTSRSPSDRSRPCHRRSARKSSAELARLKAGKHYWPRPS